MSLAPVIKHQFFTTAGAPAAGYKLFSYIAGTTTKQATYSDAALATPNTNPIVLDSGGRASIFLSAASYKFVLATDTDTDPPTSPIWTMDNISAVAELTTNQDIVAVAGENIAANDAVYISDGSGGKTSGRWYKADADETYSSSAALLVGMAPSAITSGASGTVRISGRITGLSSLTAGSTYYVSATAGAITATAPSNQRIIGVADTTTSLIISPGGVATTTGTGTSAVEGPNLCADAQMLIWAAGELEAPSHYALGGVTPTINQAGDGFADTERKYGPYCAKLTGAAGGVGTLTQALLPTATFDAYWQSKSFGFGAYVKCGTAGRARVFIADGAGTSYSSYNAGTGWEWVSVTRTLDGAASELTVGFSIAASTVGYVSGFTAVLGSTAPSAPIPSPTVYGTIVMKKSGTLSLVDYFDSFMPARPLLVKDVLLRAATAPTGDIIEVDVSQWDGSAQQSMFSTKPHIDDGQNYGQAQPDGSYQFRCFGQAHAAAYDHGLLSASIKTVGSGTAGADLTVFIRCLQYARPLESWLGYNE